MKIGAGEGSRTIRLAAPRKPTTLARHSQLQLYPALPASGKHQNAQTALRILNEYSTIFGIHPEYLRRLYNKDLFVRMGYGLYRLMTTVPRPASVWNDPDLSLELP